MVIWLLFYLYVVNDKKLAKLQIIVNFMFLVFFQYTIPLQERLGVLWLKAN